MPSNLSPGWLSASQLWYRHLDTRTESQVLEHDFPWDLWQGSSGKGNTPLSWPAPPPHSPMEKR